MSDLEHDDRHDDHDDAPEAVAVLSMAGRFPGAAGPEELWQKLRAGVECVSFMSDDELEPRPSREILDNPDYVKARGVLDGVGLFDADFFDVSPREAELLDPQHRLFLECAWQALEQAGYPPERVSGPVGVYGGTTSSTYLTYNIYSNPDLIHTVGGYQVGLATDKDFITTRVSYKLNLRGPSVNVQTACSTSLVAVAQACQALLTYQCDMALAGGSSVRVPQKTGYMYEQGGLDSSDGHCRAFDAKADGSVYGSGVGMVLLKRLEDALADGDPIEAVILGAAINNDGSSKVGFTAPSIEGQAEVIATAHALAEIDPATVQYVETHGTGTALGDPIEISALTRAFGGSAAKGSCAIGSVKPNVGHLSAAAGVTGLIKTVLALKHREIPPSINFEEPNPQIAFEETPFFVNDRLRSWDANGGPRRAAVSSFGLGGTNAHVILEEAPARTSSGPSRPVQLYLLSARTESALEATTDNLTAALGEEAELDAADVAYTLQVGRRAFPKRRALVARDLAEASKHLAERTPGRVFTAARQGEKRPLVFLFSGLGDHYPNLARGLYEGEELFRREVDRAAEILEPHLGEDIREVLFPGPPPAPPADSAPGKLDLRGMLGRARKAEDPGQEEARKRLARTALAQPALFVIEHALARLWRSWGLEPEALIGYSLGEYVAACIAGVLSLEDSLALVARRARLIDALPEGAMLAVPLESSEVEGRLPEDLDLVAINGPHLSVVAGSGEAVDRFAAELEEDDIPGRRLTTTHAFHSRQMSEIAEAVTETARGLTLRPPEIPLLSNVTGTWLKPEEATDPGYWARHLVSPVRFFDGLTELWSQPARVLLELGPGQGLTTLALQHPGNDAAESTTRVALPSLRHSYEQQDDQAFLLTALGRLWMAGLEVDWTAFYGGETRRRVVLPTYPFERRRYWIEPGPGLGMAVAAPGADAAADEGTAKAEATAPAPAPAEISKHGRPELATPYAPPRDETERTLVEMWEELLGIDRPGIHDSFFELGGHSLQGTRLLSRLRDTLSVQLPLALLFEGPTIAELAATVREESDKSDRPDRPDERDDRGLPPLVPVSRDRDLPLSFAQERLWFLDQLDPGRSFYNVFGALELKGPFSVEAIRRAFRALVERHEALRTTFVAADGPVAQIIHPPGPMPMPLVDLGGLPAERRGNAFEALARQDARRGFDLARGPLLRVLLARLGEERHGLVLVIHHTISDAWSVGILFHELTELYEAFVAGRPPSLPELPVQSADHAVWQRQWLTEEVMEGQIEFWRRHLAGAPAVLELPTDFPRPPLQGFAGSREHFHLPPARLEAVMEIGQTHGATLYMTCLAALHAVLARYAGNEHPVVGTPVATRYPPETEALVGPFLNTLPFAAQIAGGADNVSPPLGSLRGDNVGTFLERTRDAVLAAHEHQDVPFSRLVEELQPERDLGQTPIFQVLMVLQNAPHGRSMLSGLEVTQVPIATGMVQFDLILGLSEDADGGLGGVFDYRRDLWQSITIRRLIGHFETVLEAMAAAPEQPIADLPLLRAEERVQLLHEWSGRPGEYAAERCLHQLIEEQARRTGEVTALECEGAALTYGELNRRANQLAHTLIELRVGPEVPVAVCVERSNEAVVALVAVMKAGGAYVPLDPAYPRERLEFMLEDSQAPLILTQKWLAPLLGDGLGNGSGGLRTLPIDEGWERYAGAPEADPPPRARPENLVYQIYTSGSTGRPKCVLVPHRGLVSVCQDLVEVWKLAPGSRHITFNSLAFDASASNVYPVLLSGATYIQHPDPASLTPRALEEFCDRHRITHLDIPPSYWSPWLEELRPRRGENILPDLVQLNLGGDSASLDKVRAFSELTGGRVTIFGPYGPTEATVGSLYHLSVDGSEVPSTAVRLPIGKTFINTWVHLLDAALRPVPIGHEGELYLAGVGVTRGYLHRAGETAERFIPDPFAGDGPHAADRPAGSRLYRTGDLARWLDDGTIEFLGRVDHQIKLRGFRIELGEIEAALERHPAVQKAVVVALEKTPGDKHLVAYLVPAGPESEDGEGPSPAELRAFLGERLPAYMAPSAVVWLEVLPLSPTGKVERRTLPVPDWELPARGTAASEPPRTPLEEALLPIFTEVLGQTGIGRHDDFFDLGGHSLLATQAMSRIREQWGVDLPLRTLFEAPTLAAMAERLGVSLRGAPADEAPLAPVPRDRPLPLSFAQQRLWFLAQLDPGSAAYNLPDAFLFHGDFSIAAFQAAVGALVRRHENLRTTFAWGETGATQVIAPPFAAAPPLPLVDLRGLGAERRDRELRRLAAREARRPFDLARGPLLRVTVVLVDDGEHGVLMNQHHIISDGWSVGIFIRELTALYAAFREGRAVAPPRLPLQYADYAVWQHQRLSGEGLERELGFWRRLLDKTPPSLDLPTDRPRPEVGTTNGASCRRRLSSELSRAVRELSRAEKSTVFMTLLAAYKVLLYRYSGQDDVVVGVGVANRNRVETESLIGFFVNTLPMRTRLHGNPSFRELLGRVREVALECFAHEDMPFDKLVEELEVKRDLSRMPLVQVAFVLQNMPMPDAAMPDLELERLVGEATSAKWDLMLAVTDTPENLLLSAEYNTDLFDTATVERFLARYERLLASFTATAESTVRTVPLFEDELAQALELEPARLGAAVPLTATQRDLYLDHLIAPHGTTYSLGLSVKLGRDLDPERWRRAVETVSAREEAARTRVVTVYDEPYQVLDEEHRFAFELLELGKNGLDSLADVVARKVKVPYDLGADVLLRHFLVRHTDGSWTAVLAVHHIVCDAYSGRLFFERVSAVYSGAEPIEPARFFDTVSDNLRRFDTPENVGYWRERLASVAPLELQTGVERPSRWAAESAVWDGELLARVRAFSAARGAHAAALLRALYAVVLERLLRGGGDLLLHDVVAGRPAGHGATVGCFYQVVPVVLEAAAMAPERTFEDFLAHVRGYRRGLGERQDISVLEERRLAGRGGLRFYYNYYNFAVVDLAGETSILAVHDSFAEDEVHLLVSDNSDHLALHLHYNERLFADLAIVPRLEQLLHQVVDGAALSSPPLNPPRGTLGDLDVLLDAERRQLLEECNDTAVDYARFTGPGAIPADPQRDTLANLVAAQAARTPEAVALIFDGSPEAPAEELTYGEFDRRVGELAAALRQCPLGGGRHSGIGPEDVVGVFMERSVEMVVALHAIVRAGGAYLPIHPLDPAERVAFMLADARVGVVLTESRHRERLPATEAKVLTLDELPEGSGAEIQPTSPDHLAYVIYTSGSTGQPKGAMNTHRAIVNRLLWMQQAYPLDAEDRVLQKTPYTFDVSVWEFFWPLMVGARLVVARPEGHKDNTYLAELIRRRGITTLHFVPSMLQVFLADPEAASCSGLKRVITSGEALSVALQQRFFKTLGDCDLHNLYGPTEAAVDVTFWPCEDDEDALSVPIGRPIANLGIYLQGRGGELVPRGLPGELLIGGVGLARGYFRRPRLTAERFVPDPWSLEPGARLYRTGDLARRREDGAIDFLGRLDHQVKLRGFRIELGEIEAVLERHPAVAETVVMAREDAPGGLALAAYVVPAGAEPEAAELREFLARSLPDYMVPAFFVMLGSMPLNPNGKADRRALPAPTLHRGAVNAQAAPRTETERHLARIYQQVLGLEAVGLDDNFFDLGGHSLLLAQVSTALKKELGLELSMVELFQYPTIAALGAHLDEQATRSAPDATSAAASRRSASQARAEQRQRAARRRPDARPRKRRSDDS